MLMLNTTLFAVIEAFGNDKDELERNISNELRMINLWFKSNKLSINVNKTNNALSLCTKKTTKD